MSLPKVLVLGQPFHRNSGGGITLSNLFSGWDPDRLAVVCIGNLLEGEIDTEMCRHYYRLGTEEHHWVFPLSLIKRKYESGPLKRTEGAKTEIVVNKAKWRVKLIMDYFFPMLEYLGVFHLLSRIVISERLREWLDDFEPDVIYAQAPTREMVLFCLAVEAYLQKPMVYHLMDDWPSTIGNRGPFRRYWKNKVDQDLQLLLDRSACFLSISDLMSQEYERRFGKSSVAFHNPVVLDFWQAHQRQTYELPEQPDVLYAGRTGLGIDASLQTVAAAIQQVNQDLHTRITLTLQTDIKPDWAEAYDCVRHQYFVPYESLPEVFSGADLLLLPYDFSEKSLQFIRYSMPTKASEFMVSGTPILLFAPEGTAVVDYARAYGWAAVFTQNEVQELAGGIKELILDQEMRQQLGQRAIELAESRHAAQTITRAFREVICKLHPKAEMV